MLNSVGGPIDCDSKRNERTLVRRMDLNIVYLNRMDYKEALELQERVLELRLHGNIQDTLLMVEHPPVITIGRSGNSSNILLTDRQLSDQGVTVYEVNRGGDVTYHGPGQIVGYPIMDLNNHGRDIKQYIWNIEEVFIRLLKEQYAIIAERDEKKYTGVWVEDKKITAIGIFAKQWITMHGFAFNIGTDLEHFKWINPCGITDKGVTSLQQILGHQLDFRLHNELVIQYFCEVFNLQPKYLTKEELLKNIVEVCA